MIVTINGADGSGKSTILIAIAEGYQENFLHYHSRPGNIVPKNNRAKQRLYQARPNEAPQRTPCLQIIKVALFYVEFQLFAIWHTFIARRKLVILERSLIDLYVHPARYGLDPRIVEKIQPWLTEWYSDLNICLIGDPRIMSDRKRELDTTQITELNRRYLDALSRPENKLFVIDTTKDTVAISRSKLITRLRNTYRNNIAG